jgi:hypothetical protein
MKYIIFYGLAILIMGAGIFIACGDNGTDPDDNGTKDIAISENYFPFETGDIWYYTFKGRIDIVRTVADDTTIAARQCTKIRDNDTTTEAWSKDTSGFHIHLLDEVIRFQPPLEIPFGLRKGQSFDFYAVVYITIGGNLYEDETSGTLINRGGIVKEVPAGRFEDVLKIHYIQELPQQLEYDEYYAPGVGLIDNGDLILDSAFIGGIWYKP